MDIQKNRKILIVMHSLISLLLIGVAFFLVILSQACDSNSTGNLGCFSAYALAALFPTASFIAVYSLLKPNKATRIYMWLYSALLLISFPIGTAIGGYTMYFLHKSGSNNV